jgi:hypothetical protein
MFRRHWLAIFHNPTWLGLFVAGVSSHRFLPERLKQAWPSIGSFFPRDVRFAAASHVLSLLIMGLFVLAGMNLLTAIGWWYATRIVLDEDALTVRMPLTSNSIPLQAIQDVQTARPVPGLLFNYGTLIIYSGNETANIDYIPDVESVAQMLYHRKP